VTKGETVRRTRKAGLIGAVVAFARSPQGQRALADARRKLDTPANRAKARETLSGLRSRRTR
jgi:hypothetical protein